MSNVTLEVHNCYQTTILENVILKDLVVNAVNESTIIDEDTKAIVIKFVIEIFRKEIINTISDFINNLKNKKDEYEWIEHVLNIIKDLQQ